MEENIKDNTGTDKNEYYDILQTEDCITEGINVDKQMIAGADIFVGREGWLTPEQIKQEVELLQMLENKNES